MPTFSPKIISSAPRCGVWPRPPFARVLVALDGLHTGGALPIHILTSKEFGVFDFSQFCRRGLGVLEGRSEVEVLEKE
jgi:hypothetical protein